MYRFIVGVIIGALTYAVFCGEVRSDVDRDLVTPEGTSLVGYDMAPVQVDVYAGASISQWDCFPTASSSGDAVIMVAHLMYPSGIASYTCQLVSGGRIVPLPHYHPERLASYSQ